MKIVLFTHPSFLTSQSMPRFAAMLSDGMEERGHTVDVLSPKPLFFNIPVPAQFKKWFGYIDQYIIFPGTVKAKLSSYPKETLFVFADQALGPWIPLVADRPHVIHCHDFLAQQSAKGQMPENPVGRTGVQYQKYIRRGYLSGKNFIAVSRKTQADLHDFYGSVPTVSEVVYNGLTGEFSKGGMAKMRERFSRQTGIDCSKGYILHVGGNQWYKNRQGVLEIYSAWRSLRGPDIPLILIGAKPDERLMAALKKTGYMDEIHFLSGIDDDLLKTAYAGASVFLFPSLAEGFGWPIAEAMASGVPVITTNEAPMTEVAGDAAFLIERRPANAALKGQWAKDSALVLDQVLKAEEQARENRIDMGLENVKRFDSKKTLDLIESIYLKVLEKNI
ncbi:glycosyltransferase family 1 protein [Pedobacter psychroterrae]|uniref:Glycosyltransferase family 1 protein n=2 Tax=Pedobacter psychroterrae TaxID=2530453 RepID=A0A4R0NS08_9SPHI|nr:glycosyltransferase family 1 protein [Pedobacter psychroterrae]